MPVKKRWQYERLFLLDEYNYLRQTNTLAFTQEQINGIVNIVWGRLLGKQNSYEILRILLGLQLVDWQKTNIILPSRGEPIKETERIQEIARQKQLTPIIERGNGKWQNTVQIAGRN